MPTATTEDLVTVTLLKDVIVPHPDRGLRENIEVKAFEVVEVHDGENVEYNHVRVVPAPEVTVPREVALRFERIGACEPWSEDEKPKRGRGRSEE